MELIFSPEWIWGCQYVSMLMVSGDYGWIARTCWKWKGGRWGLAGPQQSTDNSTNISDKTSFFLRLDSSNFGFVVIEFQFDKNMELTKSCTFRFRISISFGSFFLKRLHFPVHERVTAGGHHGDSYESQLGQRLQAATDLADARRGVEQRPFKKLGIIPWKMAALGPLLIQVSEII